MTRVGFIFLPDGSGWLGGVNYFRNLLRAVTSSSGSVVPVALVDSEAHLPASFPQLDTLRCPWVAPRSPRGVARRGLRKALHRDFILEHFLRSHEIDVLSHSGWLGQNSKVPAIAWIPDFQHVHLPQFFSMKERRNRDRGFQETAERSQLLILSSEAARNDLKRFAPEAVHKSRVLRFADCTSWAMERTAPQMLCEKYKLPEKYLALPNQYWAHKNHRVVIEALGVLRAQGRHLTVVSTGHTQDYRNASHFSEISHLREKLRVESEYRILGVVPYEDLAGLMSAAAGIINPSLFEGWSTTVEEARALGKRTILSSIDVHVEQSPPRAVFFDPHDPIALAEQLWRVWEEYFPDAEREAQASAARLRLVSQEAFGAAFRAIAMEADRKASHAAG